MDASHVAAGTITALIASVLVYATNWPLQPLDQATAMSIAGLLVAVAGGVVNLYQMARARPSAQITSTPTREPRQSGG